MLYNEENKNLMYKWRQKNKDAYRKVVREGFKKYYDENTEKISVRKKKSYRFKVECERLRNIEIFA
jgi:hypothetical protein